MERTQRWEEKARKELGLLVRINKREQGTREVRLAALVPKDRKSVV